MFVLIVIVIILGLIVFIFKLDRILLFVFIIKGVEISIFIFLVSFLFNLVKLCVVGMSLESLLFVIFVICKVFLFYFKDFKLNIFVVDVIE